MSTLTYSADPVGIQLTDRQRELSKQSQEIWIKDCELAMEEAQHAVAVAEDVLAKHSRHETAYLGWKAAKLDLTRKQLMLDQAVLTHEQAIEHQRAEEAREQANGWVEPDDTLDDVKTDNRPPLTMTRERIARAAKEAEARAVDAAQPVPKASTVAAFKDAYKAYNKAKDKLDSLLSLKRFAKEGPSSETMAQANVDFEIADARMHDLRSRLQGELAS